jgi:hypothetical protein
MYGSMYGMQKTTIYLPEHLKGQLARLASSRGVSEAQLIRDALSRMVESETTSRPRIPLFASADPTLAERGDESLDGFGEQ